MISNKQKYLNIDKGFNRYVVRVVLSGKHLIVWRGSDYELGLKIAKKVEEKMSISKSQFLDWYDYESEEFIRGIINGNKNENK